MSQGPISQEAAPGVPLPQARTVEHDGNRPIRLLQLTDCHIGPDAGEELLGLNTDESLRDVIAHVRQHHPSCDVLLTTGDIANNGGTRTYSRYLEIIAESRIQYRAFAWLPGNHDSPGEMNRAVGNEALTKLLTIGNWLIVLLNTQVPGETHGNLTTDELQLLERTLSENPDKHVLIFMHHQPVPVGTAWIDGQRLRSEGAFFDVVDRYSQVKAVVWGHVHQEFAQQRHGVQLLATPATSIQFKAGSDDFAVDHLMPGYRWFDLQPDGTFSTQVERIEEKHYPIQFSSQGY